MGVENFGTYEQKKVLNTCRELNIGLDYLPHFYVRFKDLSLLQDG